MGACNKQSGRVWQLLRTSELSVTIIGAGNWGTVIGRMVAANTKQSRVFRDDVRMWLYEEEYEGRPLSEVINERHENPKYLPGIALPTNLRAVPDLAESCAGSNLFVFVLPCQFLKRTCDQMKALGLVGPDSLCISLTKGLFLRKDGPVLCTKVIQDTFGCECSVLCGANIASECARECFSEGTIGYHTWDVGQMWHQLLETPYYLINMVPDVSGVEACGGLKNIIAMATGFAEGLKLGANARAALIRIGFGEMRLLITSFFDGVMEETFWESCGIADVIATCGDGRNSRCAAAFVARGAKDSWETLETEMLGGQKLQGIVTLRETMGLLQYFDIVDSFPLINATHQVACEGKPPKDFMECVISQLSRAQYPTVHFTPVSRKCTVTELKEKIAHGRGSGSRTPCS